VYGKKKNMARLPEKFEDRGSIIGRRGILGAL
jgi:hypothetical protein